MTKANEFKTEVVSDNVFRQARELVKGVQVDLNEPLSDAPVALKHDDGKVALSPEAMRALLTFEPGTINLSSVTVAEPEDRPVALKHDQGKPDLTLLPRELLEAGARAYMFGAKKYSRGNFKNGFAHSRPLAAALRHIVAYCNGEKTDPESGLSHLDHAVAALGIALHSIHNYPENDDLK